MRCWDITVQENQQPLVSSAFLINKTSGTIKVFGYDLDRQLAQLKRHIGLVPTRI